MYPTKFDLLNKSKFTTVAIFSPKYQGFGSGSACFCPVRIRVKKVRKGMNKSLFCRVGDVQCKQFHFFCSDFSLPFVQNHLKREKNKKKIHFYLYHHPPPPDTPRIRIRIRMKIFARIRIRIRKKMRIRNPVFFPDTKSCS